MEIKVICPCGTKFKFDVEPVAGRMPAAIHCPNCNADATALANDAILRQSSGVAAGDSPPVARSGLRIAGQAEPEIATTPPAAPEFQPAPAYVHRPAAAPSDSGAVWKTWVVLLLCLTFLGFGAWKFGSKWYKRIKTVTDIASAPAEADSPAEAVEPHNFWFQDATVLFIKHPSHEEVARACADFWRDKLRRPLTILTNELDTLERGRYELWPEQGGYVRLFGGLDWPQIEYEGLSQFLSERFKTTVFEVRDVDFTGAYHFGVYEQGARKFHAQMDIKLLNGDLDEVVTTEGNDWALAHGYKPGPEGFKEFHLGDADKLAQNLGLKTWEEKPGVEQRAGLWLLDRRPK